MRKQLKFDERNFCDFINGDNDVIKDYFLDYLCRFGRVTYYSIPEFEGYRIDLITRSTMLNRNYYWILMRLNGILHAEELAPNRLIKYINVQDMESAYMAWKTKEFPDD
jgi:hypothetical protein